MTALLITLFVVCFGLFVVVSLCAINEYRKSEVIEDDSEEVPDWFRVYEARYVEDEESSGYEESYIDRPGRD